jgi:formylglycine-generating enzyme required for sulfatase activity
MVVVPAGRAMIGGEPVSQAKVGTPPEIAAHQTPRHEVRIARPFALGRTPVTRAQFARFVAATGYAPAAGCNYLDVATNKWGPGAYDWRNPGFPQTDQDPVVCVAWPDAVAYVGWLSKVTGKPYRLPSEAEYEYAARAGSPAVRYWGDDPKAACRHANSSGLERAQAHRLEPAAARFLPCRDGFVYTSPVATYPPNAFGLYDMLGNVWQWTEDCYNADHTGAPVDGSARMTGDCGGHVDKGSSWVNSPHYLSAAARHKDVTDNRDTVLGFRVARDIVSSGKERP